MKKIIHLKVRLKNYLQNFKNKKFKLNNRKNKLKKKNLEFNNL